VAAAQALGTIKDGLKTKLLVGALYASPVHQAAPTIVASSQFLCKYKNVFFL